MHKTTQIKKGIFEILKQTIMNTLTQWVIFLVIPLVVYFIFFSKKHKLLSYLGLKKPEKVEKSTCIIGGDEIIKKGKSILVLILITFLVLNNISPAYAKEDTAGLLALSKVKIKEEIDRYIQENEETTAGVAISIFDDKESLYHRNYGYADIENKILIDEDTVFDWGSATKILVWVSVIQLWEQGKIELDKDIRNYLPKDFLAKTDNTEKITMLNLMHHDAGWQEVVVDLFVEDMKNVMSLKKTLQKTEPEKIYPVGEIVAYSNWGAALAAYIVEELSEQKFYEYVHENIFMPLEMKNTALLPDLSDNVWVKEKRKEIRGYTTDREMIEKDFFHIPLYPAGMATGTMEDFEKFAKSLVGWDAKGRLFQKNETYHYLLEPTLYYGDTGIARNSNGLWYLQMAVPVAGHGGNTAAFSSYLLIDPARKIGAAVMTNQLNEEVYNIEMMPLVFGIFEPTSSAEFSPKQENLKGSYQNARTILKGYIKIYSAMTRMKVEEEDTGELKIHIQGSQYKAKPFKPFLYDYDGSLLHLSQKVNKPIVLSQAYGDYYQLKQGKAVMENIINFLAIVSLLYSVILLLVELVRFIISKVKKKTFSSDYFRKYYLVSLGIIMAAFVNVMMMVLKLSKYSILESVRAHVYISFAVMIALVVYAIFLPFGLMRANVMKRTKLKYILSGAASFIVAFSIYYWELYLLIS